MIKQGIVCRVGNGQDIDILQTPWLSVASDPYVQTHNVALIDQKVSSLMTVGERSWDVDLIMDLFEERYKEIILSIPLVPDENDFWYQRADKMGRYTVKRAYLLLQEDKIINSSANNSGFWRKL